MKRKKQGKNLLCLVLAFIFASISILSPVSTISANENIVDKLPAQEDIQPLTEPIELTEETSTLEESVPTDESLLADGAIENQMDNIPLEGFDTMMMRSASTLALEPIQGTSSVKKEDIKTYLKSIIGAGSYTSYHDQVIDTYYTIAPIYNIRPEVAIAQSLLETNYYRYTGIVKRDQYNFAGIFATGVAITSEQANDIKFIYGADPTQVRLVAGEHGARFASIASGIEGHIQHLYVYASSNALPAGRTLIDPRFKLVSGGSNCGKSIYINDLVGWATDPVYGTKIVTIMSNFPKSAPNLDEELPWINNLEDGYYTITTKSSLNIDINGNELNAENGKVISYSPGGTSSQTIKFTRQGDGSYLLTFGHSNKALTLTGAKAVVQSNVTGADNQLWYLHRNSKGQYFLKNKATFDFLEEQGTTIGVNSLNTQNSGEMFLLTKTVFSDLVELNTMENGYYKISSKENNLTLDIKYSSLADYGQVAQHFSYDTISQILKLEKNVEDNTYRLVFMHSGKSLDGGELNIPIQLFSHAGTNQRWKLYQSGDGSIFLKNVATNRYITLNDAGAGSSPNLTSILDVNSNKQKFTFTSVKLPSDQLELVTTIADGNYEVKSRANSLTMGTYYISYSDNDKARQITDDNKTNTTLYFKKQVDNSYIITYSHSGKALSINENERALVQSTPQNADSQKWFIYKDDTGNYYFKNKKTAEYIEVISNNDCGTYGLNTIATTSTYTQMFKIAPVATMPSFPYIASIDNGYYLIQNVYSEKYLEVNDGSKDSGATIGQWTKNGYNNQVFELKNTPYGATLFNVASGKAMDVYNDQSGSIIQQADFHGGGLQQFNIQKTGNDIYNIFTYGNKALDAVSKDNLKVISKQNFHTGQLQQFRFIKTPLLADYPAPDVPAGTYTITSKTLNVPLAVKNNNSLNGGVIGFEYLTGQDNQKMIVEPVSSNSNIVRIKAYNSNRYLQPLGNSGLNGTAVVAWHEIKGSSYQEWNVIKNVNGTFSLQNRGTLKYLDISWPDRGIHASLELWDYNTSANKQFVFTRTGPLPATGSHTPGITGKIIYIDPGHGTYDSYYNGNFDPGAVKNGLYECSSNMWFASELAAKLKAQGAIVYMSRDVDYTSANAPWISLYDRPRSANKVNADIFISLHGNSSTNTNVSGIETYYYDGTGDYDYYYSATDPRNLKSADLAYFVQQGMVNYSGSNNRGTRQSDFCVIRETKMPAVLLEIGYLSNASDASLIKNSTYRTKVVNGIISGLGNYFYYYY